MVVKNFKTMWDYLKNGFHNTHNYENALKIYLIYIFSSISLIVFLILGINATDIVLKIFLLGGALLFFLNMVYLYVSYNYIFSGYVVVYFLLLLMFYLVYSGGIDNTGPIWSFILPPAILFLHGLKKGFKELIIYLTMLTFILFYKEGIFLDTTYTSIFKVRILLILSIVFFLSFIYQYAQENSIFKMKKMQEELEYFLVRDPLTGLYNRRGYDDNIKNTSYGSILMCDIDHFKSVNDKYGHDAGDYALKEVAKIIKEELRDNDVSVRWGGEEFLIFLSETNVSKANSFAERLRYKIEHNEILYENKSIYVTFSIGISIIENNISLEEAIKNADHAMYVSKMEGRNKVSCYYELV